MTDDALRLLERNAAASPNDQSAQDLLEHARLRAGRGWHGDRLPWNDRGNMAAEGERLVYRWLVAPLAALEIQFVYVPGGEVECRACAGTGWKSWHGYSGPERDGCDECHDPKPGIQTIQPFYISRYPISWEQFRAFCFNSNGGVDGERLPCFPWEELRPEHLRHPVVRVSMEDAKDFCQWSGLRLPTPAEWSWAAIGPKDVRHDGHHYDNENSYEDDVPLVLGKLRCLRCGDRGVGLHERPCLTHRRYPWGDKRDPRGDQCVTASTPGCGGRTTSPLTVACCKACGRNCEALMRTGQQLACCQACSQDGVPHEVAPARPTGASWCGAQDMAGNVWEWRSDGSALGGSFRTECGPQLDQPISRRLADVNGLPWSGSRDDIGFRVAISIERVS